MFAHALVLEDLIQDHQLELTLSNKKIGYYIGSFDPLHLGHESVVKLVIDSKLCDYVIICPAWGGDTYKNRTDVNIRLEMLFAAFKHNPHVIVTKLSPVELQNALTTDNPDVTILGKPTVMNRFAGANYIGIIGSDVALDSLKPEFQKNATVFMQGIKIPEKYKENTTGGIMALPVTSFVIAQRQGDILTPLKGHFAGRIILDVLETPYPEVSSSKIKTMLKEGKTLENVVSPAVADLINKHSLFQY